MNIKKGLSIGSVEGKKLVAVAENALFGRDGRKDLDFG